MDIVNRIVNQTFIQLIQIYATLVIKVVINVEEATLITAYNVMVI